MCVFGGGVGWRGGGGGCDKAKTCHGFLIDSNKLETWQFGGGEGLET